MKEQQKIQTMKDGLRFVFIAACNAGFSLKAIVLHGHIELKSH